MGKFDHIPELVGSENYVGWSTKMQYALACEDLWCHINTTVDLTDLLGTPSFLPTAVDPANVTAAERILMREWLLNDIKAKDLITRRLSASIGALVSRSHTVSARKAWQILAEHFNRTDTSAQYQLRQRLDSLRMKDSADATDYVGQHAVIRERLRDSGAPLRDGDAIYSLLIGLPQTPIWQQFKSMLEQRMHDEVITAAAGTVSIFTIDSCVSRITAEAARHIHAQAIHSARPGSEYANAATSSNSTTSSINNITGLRKHKHNPQGIFCTTPGCNKGDHDHEHCYGKGGGMEGQAPWMRTKRKEHTKETAAAVITPPAPTPSVPAVAAAVTPAALSSLYDDVSFASIEGVPDDVSCSVSLPFATILDSGTTVTLVKDRSFFHTYSTAESTPVHTANHGILETTGRGTCVGWLTIGKRRLRLRLSNCLHAPNAMLNLLSVSSMNAKGWDVSFRANMTCELTYKQNHLGAIPATGKLYAVDLDFIPVAHPATNLVRQPELSAFAHVPLSLDLWHARIGHIGRSAVMRLDRTARGVTVESASPLSHCESCIVAKHPHQPFHASETGRAQKFLDLIHADVCGPIQPVTPHGKHYFVIFLDDSTHALDLQLLATKDQALAAWRTLRARWENLSGSHVKTFRSDNGGEFINEAFTADLEQAGITRQRSAPYAHQQNGKAEHVMRTIEGRMYAMLDFARLPRSLWGEAALTACYLFNRTESRALPPGKTPYEMLHGNQPNLAHLRVFGARCFARIPTELQQKLGPRSREAQFMGYPPGVKAWRCRDIVTGAFFNSRDIIFDESVANRLCSDSDDEDEGSPSHSPTPVPPPATPQHPAVPQRSVASQPPHIDVIRHSGRIPVPTEKGLELKNRMIAAKARLTRQREIRTARIAGIPPPPSDVLVPPAPVITTPTLMPDLPPPDIPDPDAITAEDDEIGFSQALANLIVVEVACLSVRSDSRRNPLAPGYDLRIPPATHDEAMRRPDCDHWRAAMHKEMNLMSEMNVYELMSLPAGRRAIGCRWVLEFKEDLKGGPVFKARLVAQGFSQIPGVDFGRTFAPVAKSTSIRVLSAHAAAHDWELDCFDARRAFLWGKLQEDVYMRQPPGFERVDTNGLPLVAHLLSSLYGLKQAAFDWYELLRDVLARLGFLRCDADYAVFIFDHVNGEGVRIICIIAWHVDDGLAGSNNRPFLDRTKGQIAERFGITDLGPVTKYLGIQFIRDRKTRELWMHQEDYIVYLLAEHGMSDCNPVALPMDPNFPFGRPTDLFPDVDDLQTEYRKLVGELLYLAMYTRPDIALTIMRLAQHNVSAEPKHYAAAKHVLRYLAGTSTLRAHYGGAGINPSLHGFSDSDWASCPEDRISISGYVWFYNGGPVSHSAKKQTTQALSSTEAEYMALTSAIQDGLWLQSFFGCLSIPLSLPLQLFADNAGAIALSKEAANHTRTKHIDLRYHFIRRHIEEKTFAPVWLSTHKNTADIFTKLLPRPAFMHHRSGLALVCY